jgi:ABC-type uncharacterized transport system permease subunit
MILSFDPAVVLAWAAVAAYVLSALGRPLGPVGLQAAALALHGLSLAIGFGEEAHAGLGIRFGFAPVLSLTVWLVLAVHFAESRLVPIAGLRRAFSVAGAAAVVLWIAFPGEVVAVVRSPYAPLHWALGIASYGLFGVAVLHALLLDAAERRMRQKDVANGVLGLPLLSLERLTFNFVEAGFVLLTLAIVLGLVSLGGWVWDPKTVLSVASWATFLALIIGRRAHGWRGRQATRWLYSGAVLILFAYVGSRFVFEIVLQRAPTGTAG